MKAAQIAVGLLAFVGGGAASFVVTRNAIGTAGRGGAATREALVAATIAGINAGDREALLEIIVGPLSDRVAVACDDEGAHDAEARDQRRGERVDDTLGEAKRRKLVLDRIGDDREEVVAKAGDEIDNHCKARIDVVKHEMELALHDTKSVAYTAHLSAVDVAGRWYLAKLPAMEPSGGTPAPTTPAAPDDVASLAKVHLDLAPGDCTAYVKELQRLRSCSASQQTRSVLTTALREISDTLAASEKRTPDAGDLLSKQCKTGLDMLHEGLFGC